MTQNTTSALLDLCEHDSGNYNNLIRIHGEQDLLIIDPTSKLPIYLPCSQLLIDYLERQSLHLREELEYTVNEMRMVSVFHLDMGILRNVYNELSGYLCSFFDCVRRIHKSIYVSIYYNWIDKVQSLYERILKTTIDQFLTLFDETERESVHHLHQMLHFIVRAFGEIGEIDHYRTHAELREIFVYIKAVFLNSHIEASKASYEMRKNEYFDCRLIPCDTNGIRGMVVDINNDLRKTKLGNVWSNTRSLPEADMAFALYNAQCSEQDFDELFCGTDLFMRSHNELEARIEAERNGDPVFLSTVDVQRLKDYLSPWILAYVTTQEKWYIVWCIMKYSLSMIRPEITLQQFADYMNFQFPDAEKKCSYNSVSRQANKSSHNKHLSQWNSNDPDLALARNLYDKLSKKDKYESFGRFAF